MVLVIVIDYHHRLTATGTLSSVADRPRHTEASSERRIGTFDNLQFMINNNAFIDNYDCKEFNYFSNLKFAINLFSTKNETNEIVSRISLQNSTEFVTTNVSIIELPYHIDLLIFLTLFCKHDAREGP